MSLDLGGGFCVRTFRPADLDGIVRHANNLKVARHLEDRFPHPYTRQDGEAWLEHVAAEQTERHFAIATEEEACGCIGLRPYDDVYRRTAELGYWLGEDYWGQGVATRAVQAVCRWAFDHLPLERIQARVFSNNPASCRVLEKAGFTCEGRQRHGALKINLLVDLVVYAILRHELLPPDNASSPGAEHGMDH